LLSIAFTYSSRIASLIHNAQKVAGTPPAP
jgi:hypothetical protein